MSLRRASRAHPCPICDKPDWCLIGTDIAICMRVNSSRQFVFSDKSVGFVHKIDGTPLPPHTLNSPSPKEQRAIIKCGEILANWHKTYGDTSLTYLAKSLGVTRQSLELIGCVKAPNASTWAFPMFDAKRVPIGIRMRHENGKKWAFTGSHNGLFIPSCPVPREIAICEGPTDTAAALTIGLFALGRFNNCGGVDMIIEFIKTNKVRRVMIVADCDNDRIIQGTVTNPGISGAMSLSQLLPVANCIVTLPAKDMRQFVLQGGNASTFKCLTEQLVWTNPKK